MNKKNAPLIIAISIPILMTIIVGLSIYLPSFFVKPTTDFVYLTGGDYITSYKYYVRHGELQEKELVYPENYNKNHSHAYEMPILHYYDVETAQSRELSFDEAKKLTYNSSIKSKDGFEIVSGSRGGFFYNDGNYGQKFIKKGAFSKEIDYETSDSGYYGNFRFIGWIEKE